MSIESQLTTLSNGLRIVTVPMGGVKSAVVGTWVGVGSAYETEAQNGITHFLEHMFFKGTADRNARQIAGEIESLGGQINANTGKDRTTYFTKVLGTHLTQGFNVIADMLRNPAFPQAELDRERLVVIEEIKQYKDDPESVLSDHFYEKCFAGQPLGRTILGPPEVIRSLSQQNLFDYVGQHYTPERMVVAAAGAVDHNELVKLAVAAYGDMKRAPRITHPLPTVYTGGGDVRIERDLEQLQIITAFKGVAKTHADAPAYNVLAQVLGGGMSSPLFTEVREKRGLVYGVSASSASYTDTGIFAIEAGLSPERVPEYLDALTETLRTSIGAVTEKDLQSAKNRFSAGTAFALENVYGQANRAATSVLESGKVKTVDGALAGINAVTLADLKRVHAEIFSTKPTLAAIGKLDHLESYDDFAARFSPSRFAAVPAASPDAAPAP